MKYLKIMSLLVTVLFLGTQLNAQSQKASKNSSKENHGRTINQEKSEKAKKQKNEVEFDDESDAPHSKNYSKENHPGKGSNDKSMKDKKKKKAKKPKDGKKEKVKKEKKAKEVEMDDN